MLYHPWPFVDIFFTDYLNVNISPSVLVFRIDRANAQAQKYNKQSELHFSEYTPNTQFTATEVSIYLPKNVELLFEMNINWFEIDFVFH